jgi:hypothetical protein
VPSRNPATNTPSFLPSTSPSNFPVTSFPTFAPSDYPTSAPSPSDTTRTPTSNPSAYPSPKPTVTIDKSIVPTLKPTDLTLSPIEAVPSSFPSFKPSISTQITVNPTLKPQSLSPTMKPTNVPVNPTEAPTPKVTFSPSLSPTLTSSMLLSDSFTDLNIWNIEIVGVTGQVDLVESSSLTVLSHGSETKYLSTSISQCSNNSCYQAQISLKKSIRSSVIPSNDGVYWFGFRLRIPTAWVWGGDVSEITYLFEIVGGDELGNPPMIGLRTEEDSFKLSICGNNKISSSESICQHFNIGSIVAGEWINWVIKVNFDYQNNPRGYFKIWRDNELVASANGLLTSYNDINPHFMKIGIFQANWAEGNSTSTEWFGVHYSAMKVGNALSCYGEVYPGISSNMTGCYEVDTQSSSSTLILERKSTLIYISVSVVVFFLLVMFCCLFYFSKTKNRLSFFSDNNIIKSRTTDSEVIDVDTYIASSTKLQYVNTKEENTLDHNYDNDISIGDASITVDKVYENVRDSIDLMENDACFRIDDSEENISFARNTTTCPHESDNHHHESSHSIISVSDEGDDSIVEVSADVFYAFDGKMQRQSDQSQNEVIDNPAIEQNRQSPIVVNSNDNEVALVEYAYL